LLLGLCNFYQQFIQDCIRIVVYITNLQRGKSKEIVFRDVQESAFLTIQILLTSTRIAVLRWFNNNISTIIGADDSDWTIASILFQQCEGSKVYPCSFISRQSLPEEFNYNVYHKKRCATVYLWQEWRHFVEEMEMKVPKPSNYYNLSYSTKTVKFNPRLT